MLRGRRTQTGADAEREKSRLEAVLRDLRQGVVICTPDHNVLLYNRHAQALLDHDVQGKGLGLERKLTGLVRAQPLHHTLERLMRRVRSGRHVAHPDGLSTPFLTATLDGRDSLRGRIDPFRDTRPPGARGWNRRAKRLQQALIERWSEIYGG